MTNILLPLHGTGPAVSEVYLALKSLYEVGARSSRDPVEIRRPSKTQLAGTLWARSVFVADRDCRFTEFFNHR